jgi:hypothetical protein
LLFYVYLLLLRADRTYTTQRTTDGSTGGERVNKAVDRFRAIEVYGRVVRDVDNFLQCLSGAFNGATGSSTATHTAKQALPRRTR